MPAAVLSPINSSSPDMKISFLHTIAANQPLFDQAARDLNISTDRFLHLTKPELREALASDSFDAEARSRLRACLHGLATDADVIVVTCATLGPIADLFDDIPVPVLRADAAQAMAATAENGKLTVLCAAESALASVAALFRSYGKRADLITVTHLPEVWRFFTEGDHQACHAGIVAAIWQAYAAGADVVALAHPWMAPAAMPVKGRQPFDIPHAALKAVMGALNSRQF
jgi:aspartate/glutamate racemase